MYIPPPFRSDEDEALAFARRRAFGTLIAIDAARPVATHVPFLLARNDGPALIELHVARANPMHEIILRQDQVLMAVTGPDSYISADWYESADQVSTWNYVSVHLAGTARIMPAEWTREHVDRLTALNEARLAPKKPWTTAKMTPARHQAMLSAIVGVEIAVTRVEGQWKLGQHKSPADQASVLKMLGWRGDWAGLALCEIIRDRLDRWQGARRKVG
ncbi:MAG: FMN-binding negative transcriptional regulator [Hyphomicrobiaceae bacterium]